jgi:hypothetical protein
LALKDDAHLRKGLDMHDDKVTLEAVEAAYGLKIAFAASVIAGEPLNSALTNLTNRRGGRKIRA